MAAGLNTIRPPSGESAGPTCATSSTTRDPAGTIAPPDPVTGLVPVQTRIPEVSASCVPVSMTLAMGAGAGAAPTMTVESGSWAGCVSGGGAATVAAGCGA